MISSFKMNFASDNAAPASAKILNALIEANQGAASAYGADSWSKSAEDKLREIFQHDCRVFLLSTGTAANALALASLCPPWGAVLCHDQAHIVTDECGAPEFFTHGAKLVGIAGDNGKITPDGIKAALKTLPRGVMHNVQPAVVSLSQATESGTVYTCDEIAALSAVAHAHNLSIHMDGARFANAMLHLDCTPAQMTWQAGVDVVSFGASKNGTFACEAVIFFNPAQAEHFAYLRKRAGHTLSKGRLLGAQMQAYLEAGHWLDLAAHANAMASRLAKGLQAIKGVRLAWPVEANELFVILPRTHVRALQTAGAVFYEWRSHALPHRQRPHEDEAFIRLICSFATTPDEVARFVAVAQG
jgi:threonine aldolase